MKKKIPNSFLFFIRYKLFLCIIYYFKNLLYKNTVEKKIHILSADSDVMTFMFRFFILQVLTCSK